MIANLQNLNISRRTSLYALGLVLLSYYAAVFSIGLGAYYVLAIGLLPVSILLRQKMVLGKPVTAGQSWVLDQSLIFLFALLPLAFASLRENLEYLLIGHEVLAAARIKDFSCMLDTIPPARSLIITPVLFLYFLAYYGRQPVRDDETVSPKVTYFPSMIFWLALIWVGLNSQPLAFRIFDVGVFYWPGQTATSIAAMQCVRSALYFI